MDNPPCKHFGDPDKCFPHVYYCHPHGDCPHREEVADETDEGMDKFLICPECKSCNRFKIRVRKYDLFSSVKCLDCGWVSGIPGFAKLTDDEKDKLYNGKTYKNLGALWGNKKHG